MITINEHGLWRSIGVYLFELSSFYTILHQCVYLSQIFCLLHKYDISSPSRPPIYLFFVLVALPHKKPP